MAERAYKTSERHRAYMAERRKDPEFRACQKAYMTDWLEKNREKKRAYDREYGKRNRERERIRKKKWKRKKYAEKVASLVKDHNGLCDICGGPPDGRWKKLNIDHCHATGVFRGMLCMKCNKALGFFQDDPDILRKAIEYIETDRKMLPGEAVWDG